MLKAAIRMLFCSLAFGNLATSAFAEDFVEKEIVNLSYSSAPSLRACQQEDGGFFISDPILGKRTETIYVKEEVQDFELVYTERNYSFFQGFETILYIAFGQKISAYLVDGKELVLFDEIHTPEKIEKIIPFKRTIVVGQIQNVRRFLKVKLGSKTTRILELNDGEFDLIDLREYREVAPLWSQNLDRLQTVLELDDTTKVLKQGTRLFLERTESWVFNTNQVVIYHLGDFKEQTQLSYNTEEEVLAIKSKREYLFFPYASNILQPSTL